MYTCIRKKASTHNYKIRDHMEKSDKFDLKVMWACIYYDNICWTKASNKQRILSCTHNKLAYWGNTGAERWNFSVYYIVNWIRDSRIALGHRKILDNYPTDKHLQFKTQRASGLTPAILIIHSAHLVDSTRTKFQMLTV